MSETPTLWNFDFVLQHENPGQPVTEQQADQLLDLIIEWVEANQLAIGGGYRPLLEGENEEAAE